MSHSIKPGVATGKEVQKIHQYAKEKGLPYLRSMLSEPIV